MAGEGRVRGIVSRVGGPDRLREILKVFYGRMRDDLLLGFFFAGKNIEEIVDGQHAFLMRAFQETERFHGVHPSKAHLELAPILRGHFDRRLLVLRQVLEEHDLHPLDVRAWLKVEEGMRGLVQR